MRGPVILLLALIACDGETVETDTEMETGSDTMSDTESEVESDPCEGVVTTVSAPIEAETTWECTIVIADNLVVSAPLTVAPGTVVELIGTEISVQSGGSISAVGTSDDRIVFTSGEASPSKGDWEFISIERGAAPSTFDYVDFSYGGDTNGVIQGERNRQISLSNAHFSNMNVLGIDLSNLDTVLFENVSFDEVPGYPFKINGNDVPVVGSFNFTDSVLYQAVSVVTPDTVNQHGTWPEIDFPFDIWGDLSIERNVTWPAGTHIRVRPGGRMFVADGGTLTSEGTAENPNLIEAATDAPSGRLWQWINFLGNAGDGSVLSHTTIRHGGFGDVGVIIAAHHITLESVTFEDNGPCDVTQQVAITATDTVFGNCVR